jgi:IS1 family transposase
VTGSLDCLSYSAFAFRLRKRYKIKYQCTDGNYAYGDVKIAEHHVVGKSETCFVESMNARIRRKLARFNRRTCRHSKAFDMIGASLTLLFNQELIKCIIN